MIPTKKILLFIFSGLGIFLILVAVSSLRQGWFAPHDTFKVQFATGDGINEGTPVSMSGLKAGRVAGIELGEGHTVIVKIRIQSKFAKRLRADSRITVGRPFIIGEKAISITPGSDEMPPADPTVAIKGEESLEITDMLSGGRMSPYFDTFSKLLDQLRLVIEGDGTANNKTLLEVYRQAYHSLQSVDVLASEVRTIRKDFAVSPEMSKMVKELSVSAGSVQPLVMQLSQTLPAINALTSEVVKLMPQLTKTLNETAFTMQALQRSFILSGASKELRKEQAAESKRLPASTNE
jgi:phospholipid/cholesterol/gamma-HCH transport system substrate-binding protein